MSLYVVDASVVIKWFVPKTWAIEALRVYTSGTPLHAPTFLNIEVANIVWKKLRRGEITRTEADFIVSRLPLLSLTRHPDDALLIPAFDLADKTQRTVYDCLYLALAIQLGGPMVTADDKLVNNMAATAWTASVPRVQDVP
ncbi:MAG: type II toxin-antitoxin system VapC family toxin [Gemmataceae bacterium]